MWERITDTEALHGLGSWADAAGADLWQGRDAEGRKVYCATFRREGMSVEPSGARLFYSPKAAVLAAKGEYEALEEDGSNREG